MQTLKTNEKSERERASESEQENDVTKDLLNHFVCLLSSTTLFHCCCTFFYCSSRKNTCNTQSLNRFNARNSKQMHPKAFSLDFVSALLFILTSHARSSC